MSEPRLSVIPAAAATDPHIKPRDLQLLCVLGRHTDKGGWCRRSQVKMSREMGCARSTVFDAVERLVARGYLERHLVESDSGRDSAHLYRVVLDPVIDDLSTVREEETIIEKSGSDPCRYTGTPADISAPPAGPEPAPPAGPEPAPMLTTPFKRDDDDDARADHRPGIVSRNDDTGPPRDHSGDLAERGKRVCEAMGIAWSDPSWKGDFTILVTWHAQGFDFELDILPVVADVSRRRNLRGDGPVSSLNYFTEEIRRANKRRLAPPEEGAARQGGGPSGRFVSDHDAQSARFTAAMAEVFGEDDA
ncbi:helix-turn-helix domain-containing protein [Roseibium sediminicola]|uniref:Helix-turn-helix domain-containing protein n=1 Tax=Roseibium sediminicola TaxID=2933272 RepID=A0ABT0H0I2_9HYPH|nr:helix-turn-helix domain-containing protein [Roseibium sp. CAU 1639]MCK7615197.1 helix-turn-helix domain-containing protein [Roseibium sp. CAU 1639]